MRTFLTLAVFLLLLAFASPSQARSRDGNNSRGDNSGSSDRRGNNNRGERRRGDYTRSERRRHRMRHHHGRDDNDDDNGGGDPPEDVACNDGEDNDADQLIDFPADPGCTSEDDINEVDPVIDPDDPPDEDPPPGLYPPRWDPAVSTTWFWQISERRTSFNNNVAAYDLDWDLQSEADITALHAAGKKAICYFNGGAYQPDQPDDDAFTDAMKGNGLSGWPGEYWLDHRRDDVRSIMADRIQTCADKGFDAVEADNMDGYSNGSGFALTAANTVDYIKFLSATSRAAGVAYFVKNASDNGVANSVRDWADGVVNEECLEFDECDVYDGYVDDGKPVLNAEYEGSTSGWQSSDKCDTANGLDIMAALTTLDLDGSRWLPCWPSSTPINLGGTTTAGP